MRNTKIENLALICAILVVSIHVGISGPVHSLAWCLKEFIAEGVARIAVPFFFVVSGYFLAKKYLVSDEDFVGAWRLACRKRFRSLVIPYWIWNLLYAPLLIGFESLSDVLAGRAIQPVDLISTLAKITGADVVHSPILVPLWYVRSLFVFVLLSLLLWPLVRRLRVLMPTLLYFIYLILHFYGIKSMNVIPFDGLAYFSLGLCLAIGCKFAMPKRLAGILFLALLVIGFSIKWIWVGFDILYWWVPLLLLTAWSVTPSSHLPRAITSLAFPIYILHMFVLLVLQYAWHLTAFMPDAIVFVFRWCVAVVACGVIVICLRRYFPRFAEIAFGGRA